MAALTFSKRNNIISATLDNEHIGSASYVKYSDDTALIQYIYIENFDTNLGYFKELLNYVEICITDLGFKHIYLLADEQDQAIYFDLGYLRAVKKPDPVILKDLLGVELTNFVPLIKHIQ